MRESTSLAILAQLSQKPEVMTVSQGGAGPSARAWRRPRLHHLSWLLGAYFLGAVFFSIADQLFGAPPASSGVPSAYHHAWCGAQLAGLRVELETQARGALAGAAFDRRGPALRGAWYPRWLAWHRKVGDSCRLPQMSPAADCLEQLAALGLALDDACTQVTTLSAPRRREVDQRLQALMPRPRALGR